MIPLKLSLTLSSILFVMGITVILMHRNLIFILIGIEITLNAAALAFIAAGSTWKQADSQIMYIITISIAAAEASIGLALLLQLHKKSHNLNIDSVNEMHG
ncbi:MAG: NADH-quinone oxidoreductase subunit NuoK [Candidatus Dasytiphilus stammeri]